MHQPIWTSEDCSLGELKIHVSASTKNVVLSSTFDNTLAIDTLLTGEAARQVGAALIEGAQHQATAQAQS